MTRAPRCRAARPGTPRAWFPPSVLDPVQVQRDNPDGLAQPHVVGEALRPAQPRHIPASQAGRAAIRAAAAWRRAPAAARPVPGWTRGRRSWRPGRRALLFRDPPLPSRRRFPPSLRSTAPSASYVRIRVRPGRRSRSSRHRVEHHPAAPQPDQRPFRLGQRGDLVGVEQRPVERELPAEIVAAPRARTRPPSASPVPEWGTALSLRLPPSMLDGHSTSMPAPASSSAAGPSRLVSASSSTSITYGLACRNASASGGQITHSATAQGQQQVGLGLRAEPGQHRSGCVPQRGGVDDQARIGVAPQL